MLTRPQRKYCAATATIYATIERHIDLARVSDFSDRRRMKKIIIAMLAAALFAQVADAQTHKAASPGPSDADIAKMKQKQAFEKDTDAAYRSSLQKIPEVKQNVDPWGNLRTPNAPAGAK
jgi:hypothetical protein